MIIGTGCGIPAIMACRTIRNKREKRATAMLATFMPCGAKLPVIALFAGAFFPESKWVSWVEYMGGIALVLLGALLIKAINATKFRKSFFIIELPEYKVPSLKFQVSSSQSVILITRVIPSSATGDLAPPYTVRVTAISPH